MLNRDAKNTLKSLFFHFKISNSWILISLFNICIIFGPMDKYGLIQSAIFSLTLVIIQILNYRMNRKNRIAAMRDKLHEKQLAGLVEMSKVLSKMELMLHDYNKHRERFDAGKWVEASNEISVLSRDYTIIMAPVMLNQFLKVYGVVNSITSQMINPEYDEVDLYRLEDAHEQFTDMIRHELGLESLKQEIRRILKAHNK